MFPTPNPEPEVIPLSYAVREKGASISNCNSRRWSVGNAQIEDLPINFQSAEMLFDEVEDAA